MREKPWEMWIDVGGTFTDCLAKSPAGELLKHKLLSSGITKGQPGPGSRAGCLADPQRRGDPADFWAGYHCALLDSAGRELAVSEVVGFDTVTGRLQLRQAVPLDQVEKYELTCDLEAPVIGIRHLLGLPQSKAIPPLRLRLGTTRGTNALLTRSGARTALVTTRGHGDFLHIGYQDRPHLFDLTIRKPAPLAETVLEIDERVAASGDVLISPNPQLVRKQLQQLHEDGIVSLAVCLLHADLYPAHEQLVARLAAEMGFAHVSVSSEIAPLPKLVARGETTVVDAYLNPVLGAYVEKLQQTLPGSQIRFVTSSGGLVTADEFRGHESILSGPAGGVVGFAKVAQAAGFRRAIGFDMGGTSTDVARFDATRSGGAYEFEYESRKAGVRLMTPTLAIDTVAAGGGSICRFDGAKLAVGPESAGANPGPACYGRGGPLCVTDLNLYLGRIVVDHFPFALDRPAVERRLIELARQVEAALGEKLSTYELAEGLLAIANANMVRAVRGVSIAKGEDPTEHVLVAFGGAGAQHACAVARELGIRAVLNHPDAGILSAYGIGHADVTRNAATGIGKQITEIDAAELEHLFEEIAVQLREQVLQEGIAESQIEVRRSLDMRYQGTDASLNIAFTAEAYGRQDFEEKHDQLFGYRHVGRPVEIVAARVEVVGRTGQQPQASRRHPPLPCEPQAFVEAYFADEVVQAPLVDRRVLQPGNWLKGPAIIADRHSTTVVEPDWQAEMLSGGEILLTDQREQETRRHAAVSSSAVKLELFNNLFAGIAEQMGHVLQRTAGSVNVKERLDFSCAVFTSGGALVANAPHVPVHLGAMGATVRAVQADYPKMSPGDVFVTNDPYRGGSHLPDVTVVTPVHLPETGELLFFTACRAHHAEIGGVRPGSMPPDSRSLAEEGVLIPNFALVRGGASREQELRQLLMTAPYPSRQVEENLADIRAQVAANQHGARELLALVERYGQQEVAVNMRGIQQAAEVKVRQALSKLNQQDCHFTDYLETSEGESIPLQVRISFHQDQQKPAATVDFSGTSTVDTGNLNANPAIVSAAVLYVLRLLVDEEIPLNEGALQAVEITLPAGLLNPPVGETLESTPAVAAGNVETSQRVVDLLLGALGLAGASQGTMNNLLFGDENFGYYETICGGSGATAEGPGADAVQVHMTNTRSTDPEVFERRYPVRLWEFSIRRDSGGAGKHRGGDGVVRRLEFLSPLELSLITGRRGPHPPYGAAGGSPGQLGENHLCHATGAAELLPAICEITVRSGDLLEIRTPGGGGYGTASNKRPIGKGK
ncbi:MAG: hydantoinase B/oxoprolinase family protein [Pirellulales bacterium]|nr:hydantoinase B/oxoprolinase family protein [Pirellulales bacterium]